MIFRRRFSQQNSTARVRLWSSLKERLNVAARQGNDARAETYDSRAYDNVHYVPVQAGVTSASQVARRLSDQDINAPLSDDRPTQFCQAQ